MKTELTSGAGQPGIPALFTDLYELTMAQAYAAEGMDEPAVFELFFRDLPETRNFAVAAGLEDALSFLETFRFSEGELDYLRGLGSFPESFLDCLAKTRFTGEVWAVPEGTVVFAQEPLLQVTAPILEAQLVETVMLNQIHFQTVAASKCARVTLAAAGRTVVEFGARRAHGSDAALKVARASYLTGHAGTSNVLAGKLYGIPVFGTMAHSYLQSHSDEAEAMEAFARIHPETTLLVDTYDTIEGVRKVIRLRETMGDAFQVRAIRLDSGDLLSQSFQARRMLDEAGLDRVNIFVSGGLDEHKVAALVAGGAPIDGFGVGTRMVVSEDAPTLDAAYKLVEYGGQPRLKTSAGKATYAGRKQVYRFTEGGRFARDVLACAEEHFDGADALLEPVMRDGRRLPAGKRTLEDARAHLARQLELLPEELRKLEPAENFYPVDISESLRSKTQACRERLSLYSKMRSKRTTDEH